MVRPLIVALALVAPLPGIAAGQFCSLSDPGDASTLCESIDARDVVVIARSLGPLLNDEGELRLPWIARFEVVEVLKGGRTLGRVREIDIEYLAEEPAGTLFVLGATLSDELSWEWKLALDERAASYVCRLPQLPEKGLARSAFFVKYLNDPNKTIARDAYDELSRLPYTELAAMSRLVDREELLVWIAAEETPNSFQQLYLMLLGAAARHDPRPEEIAVLEEAIRDVADESKPLYSLVSCYLCLKGEAGLPLIERLFLQNTKASYSDTYSAVLALRFHVEQENTIPRPRLAASLRFVLDRSDLADLVVADLARMEDWSVMEKLVGLFKHSQEDWLRVPVILYLRACPLPKAKLHLASLESLDPAAKLRADLVAPAGPPSAATTAKRVDTPEDAAFVPTLASDWTPFNGATRWPVYGVLGACAAGCAAVWLMLRRFIRLSPLPTRSSRIPQPSAQT